ncbi:hypothetical protein OC861_003824 [Tilletia horrida]|nr:hypothetical protein OC861_003824 [Tilletia horrida]
MSAPTTAKTAPAPSSSMLLNSPWKSQSELLPLARVDAFLSGPGGPFQVSHELIDGRIQATFESQKVSIRDLILATMKNCPGRTHIVYGDVRLKFADTYAQTMRLANALRYEYGVRKGDRIAIISRNTPHFAIAYFASFVLGAICVPINAFAEGPTLAFCIEDSDPRVVVCDVERWHRLNSDHTLGGGIQTLANKTKSLQAIVVSPWKADTYLAHSERDWLRSGSRAVTSKHGRTVAVSDWDQLHERAAAYPTLPLCPLTCEDYAMIMYTSGTTGLPKGVLSKHRHVLGGQGVGGIHVARAFIRRGQAPPSPADPRETEEKLCPSTLTVVPYFHVTGLHSGLLSCTIRGGKNVILPTYSAERALQAAKTERVKLINGVGFMIREILRLAQPGDLDALEAVSHGGSSAASELPAEAQKRRANMASTNGYGMTEMNGLVVGAFLDEYALNPQTIGHPVPSVDVKIINTETGKVVQPGEPGELLIRSPCNAVGYWRRPEATAATFLKDGFIRTGDLARQDADGYLYILDRVKDMIIRGGENISCVTVEAAVHGEPSVLECAAVGVPDERLGERVGIVVVVHPSSKLDAAAVQEFARSKGLPKFSIPEVVWIRREPLGKNANGKVVKTKLKEEMKQWIAKGGREAKL